MTSPRDELGAVVTITEMHDDIKALRNDVTVLLAQTKNAQDTTRDHETRIRALERKIWLASGSVAVIVTLTTKFLPLLSA